jgi:hypothetical protein
MIEEMGGRLAFRKTDCAVVIGGQLPKLSDEWGGYRTALLPDHMGIGSANIVYDLAWQKEWHTYDIDDSARYEEMIDIIEEKGGLLIEGEAGTGKTYSAANICRHFGDRVKRLAPTHKACLMIGGATTIHSFLRLSKKGKICSKWGKEIRKKYDVVVIDEIIMITGFLWARLVELKRMTGLTFVLIGDPRQCPPIEDDDRE